MARDITTINISLPRTLRLKMERKMKRQSYASASEYVRDLIRKDLLAQAIDQVDQLLLEGLQSGPGKPVDETFWRELRDSVTKHARKRA